ncbi:MAG: hypothetical protein V4555_14270 [Acidobacteriota bacterium]
MIRCALLFLLSPLTSLASTPPPTVDDIVAAHLRALGGLDHIHSLHSFVLHGHYHEGNINGSTYVAQMRPFYRVIGSPVEPLRHQHEGYDGSAWEYYPDPGLVVRTIGAAAAATRHTSLFDDALVDYHDHGTTLEAGGATHLGANLVYILHTTLADGFREDIYVDAATWLIDGYARTVPFHAFGSNYATHMEMGDYRSEDGFLFPHSSREIDTATGHVLDESTLDSAEINPPLAPSAFSPPEWDRTLVQQMAQRLYDERTDTVAILSTYRDFRALIGTSASTADAVDFAGYQCLKMGDVETSVALLRQNVADNPQSPRAHFGLGRALQTAGKTADANAEFDRTLTLDPTFVKARTARDAQK